jgi:membrane protein DedA with SNARE-associated domain
VTHLFEQFRIIIEHIIMALGLPGITLVMFTENLFPPIPSELVMPFAGFVVGQGKADFLPVWAAGTLGSVVGAMALYYIGRWADEPIVRRFVRLFGRWFLLSEADLDRALRAFARHGEAIVFFGRLIPIVRSLISLPAGMQRMPMGRFLIFTTLGASIWTAVLTFVGGVLGANWEQVLDIARRYEQATVLVLVALVIAFFAVRVWQRRQQRAAQSEHGDRLAAVVEVVEE